MRQWRISEAMEGGFITVVETPHFNSLANKHLTEAERQALASTLAMWNRACGATTHALFHDMYEWMDQRYADPRYVLRDMEGHFAMRWAEWIHDRVLELSPPMP